MIKSKQTLLGIALVSINMRLPITAIPPLILSIQKATGLNSRSAGLLTTLPLLTFAITAPLFASLGRRFGHAQVIFGFYLLLALGSLLRIVPTTWALILGTILIGLGINSSNILLPAIIKNDLPKNPMAGIMTYTTTMLLAGALGTGIAGVIATKLSLKSAFTLMLLLVIVSLCGILLLLKKQPQPPVTLAAKSSVKHIWHLRLAWQITAFFGTQGLIYYSLLTWLPGIFHAHGFATVTAGFLLTLLQLSSLPMAFLTPVIANRKNGVKLLSWLTGGGLVLGIGALLLPISNLLITSIIAIILGIASGAAFNLAIVFFAQKSATPTETAQISGMAQSAGYLLAAVGPVVFGSLQARTNSWLPMLWIMLVLSLFLGILGLLIESHARLTD